MTSSRYGWLAAVLLSLLACGEPVTGPGAACAQVVKSYRGLPNPVEVRALEGDPPGLVRIHYRSTNAENIPVAGQAICEFVVEAGSHPQLVSAEVDGAEVGPTVIASVERERNRAGQGR